MSWVLLAVAVGAAGAAGVVEENGGAASVAAAGVAEGVALLAAAGFARPVWSAWRMSAGVERELAAVFGASAGVGVGEGEVAVLWSWRRLLRKPMATRRVAVERFDADGRAVDFYRAKDGAEKCNQFGYTLPGRGEGKGGSPCVVLVHGGGWDGGDRTELAAFNHWLAVRGVAVAAFDYRLAPAFPWPVWRQSEIDTDDNQPLS